VLQQRHRTGHQIRVEIDHHLAGRGDGSLDDAALCPLVQARQALADKLSQSPGELPSGANPGWAKLGDYMTDPVQRITDILREVVRSHGPDNTNPHRAYLPVR
jgi:hypothetical protein